MFLIILLYALFASSFLCSKTILSYTQPIFLTGIRMFLAGIILLCYQYFRQRQNFVFKRKHIWYYAQLTVSGICLTYMLRFWALRYLPAFKTSFLYNLAPLITAFYSYIIFKEKMTNKQWLGVIIGLIGLVPILLTSSSAEKGLGEFLFISWPELAVLISVAFHSYSWIIMRKLIREKSYSPIMINGISMTAGGFIALIISLPIEGIMPVTDALPFSLLLIYVIVVSNIICYNLYGHLLRTYTVTFLSLAGFIAPLLTAFYEWVLFKQQITWHLYASSVIVFVGLFLFYKDELNQRLLLDETP